jgi:hypothetical protein
MFRYPGCILGMTAALRSKRFVSYIPHGRGEQHIQNQGNGNLGQIQTTVSKQAVQISFPPPPSCLGVKGNLPI